MIFKTISVSILILYLLSCAEVGTSSLNQDARVVIDSTSSDTSKIFIIDQTGKKWDVTHAVNQYGFQPEGFQYGLGPFAIKPILEPRFLSPGDDGYSSISGDALIVGTEINGIARAYPLYIMWKHEIVDDRFDDKLAAVGYWPLVNLTAVYSRRIDDRILTLSASGWTYRNTFVLYDYETESLWYHMQGQSGLTGISGTFADRHLPEFESVQMRLSEWLDTHPDSQILTE